MLTDLQREAFMANIEEDEGWQIRLAKKRGVSRQAISFHFRTACAKVKEQYDLKFGGKQ
jgi:hypothetical protein